MKSLTDKSAASFDRVALMILAAVSLLSFIHEGQTAYEWPAIDMAPFLSRCENPDYLTNDFFTNASSEPNSRSIFGYLVIGASRLFGGNWFDGLRLVRLAHAALLPPLAYAALLGILCYKNRGRTDIRNGLAPRIVLAVGILLAIDGFANKWFTVAWWRPWHPVANANWMAFVLGFAAIALMTRIQSRWRYIGVAFFAAATLIHPAIGSFSVAFYYLAVLERAGWRECVAVLSIAVIAVGLLHMKLFSPVEKISAADFVKHYVTLQHPNHYDPGTIFQASKDRIAIVCASLALCFFAGRRMRNTQVQVTSALFIAAYVGCLIAQYLFVNVVPVKIVVALGPSRFSMFGYFMALILLAMISVDPAWQNVRLHPLVAKSFARIATLSETIFSRISIPAFVAPALALVGLVIVFALYDDSPLKERREHSREYYEWVENRTDRDDVFLIVGAQDLFSFSMRHIGQRAVFHDECFPFREDFFHEFTERKQLAEQVMDHLEKNESQSAVDTIQTIARKYPVDYLVYRESDAQQGERDRFPGQNWCYQDEQFTVYRIAELNR